MTVMSRGLGPGISLCMIVRNEERFLADCLASVRGEVDEMCIVDTGSSDDTIAIAESFGARIAHFPWIDDFAAARNAALALATRAWIFVLDADERLLPESTPALRALRATVPDGLGRWIRCRNLADDVRGTGAASNAIVRIFPNDPQIRYRGVLHEFVARIGEPEALGGLASTIEIVHHGYLNAVMAERDKPARNLRMSRVAVDADPSDPFHAYNHAMSAMLAGDAALARAELERCRALLGETARGFRPQALSVLSQLCFGDGDYERALRIADECVQVAPTLADAHFQRGKALAVLDRRHEARDAFGAAIATGEHRAEHFVVDDEIVAWKAHNEIAATLMHEKRYAEAERWLELALAQRPAVTALLLNRARCREGLGDLEGALVGFRAVFEGYRDETSAIEYVNFVFRHGSPEVCAAAVEQALPALGAGYQRVFLGSAAAVMLRAGRSAEAEALAKRCFSIEGQPEWGLATLRALAGQYQLPALAELGRAATAVPT